MTIKRFAVPVAILVLGCALLGSCGSTKEAGDGDKDPAPTTETSPGTTASASDCKGVAPPPDTPPGPNFVQNVAATYGVGGMMISVDVDNPDEQPAYGDTADIKVWVDTGGAVTTEPTRPPDSSVVGYDLGDYRWATSNLVRTGSTVTKISVFIRVDLEGGTSAPTPLKPYLYNYEWVVDCSSGTCLPPDPGGWEDANKLP